MSARTYTVFLKNNELKVTDDDLLNFSNTFSLSRDIQKRISELFWLDLYIYNLEYGISPHDVLEEINNMESGNACSETKPPTCFKRKPLKGLWHKHFFSAHFVPHNISNALSGNVLSNLVDEVLDPNKSPIITREMIKELAHRVTHEPLEKRAGDKRLTGEWIVFAKHDQKNYYLCLNTHEAGDQVVHDRIKNHCIREFAFLSNILRAASA